MSIEQKIIYESIVDQATSESAAVIFIDGPAGSGKTILLNLITAKLRSLKHIVLCTATTGIAALNHKGGITAHSMFQLPFDCNDSYQTWGISNNSQRAELIRKAKCIVIDEAPMANKNLIEILDRGMRDLMMTTDKPFGGKLIVFAGDFRQILPIIPHGTPDDVIAATIRESNIWSAVNVLNLKQCQRIKDDPTYSNLVLQIGEGKLKTNNIDDCAVIPLKGVPFVPSLDDLIEFVYPKTILNDSDKCCFRAILSGTNESIRTINQNILNKLKGKIVHCYSADSCVAESNSDPAQRLDSTILNTLSQAGVPEHDLKLKIGAVIILIRNINFTEGLVNGTKLIVKTISRYYIEARLPSTTNSVIIPRIIFKFTVGKNGVEVMRRQFPFKLAYAMTINKSQGQTLECVGVDLRSDVFSHGQLYVALGRVRNHESIKVLVPEQRIVNNTAHTANVVYRRLM